MVSRSLKAETGHDGLLRREHFWLKNYGKKLWRGQPFPQGLGDGWTLKFGPKGLRRMKGRNMFT